MLISAQTARENMLPIIQSIASSNNELAARLAAERIADERFNAALANDDFTTAAEKAHERDLARIAIDEETNNLSRLQILAGIASDPAGLRRLQALGLLDSFSKGLGIDLSAPKRVDKSVVLGMMPPFEELAGLGPEAILDVALDAFIKSGWTEQEFLDLVRETMGAAGSVRTGRAGTSSTTARAP